MQICVSRSVVSDSLRPHGQYLARLLCPWYFIGKSAGVACHFLLQPSGKPDPNPLWLCQRLTGNRWGHSGNSVRLYFWGAPKSLQMVIAAMKLKDAYSLEEKL